MKKSIFGFSVSNIQGKEIIKQELKAGALNFVLDTKTFSENIYFIRIKTSSGVQIKKLIIIH